MADDTPRRLSIDDVQMLQSFLNERFENHGKRFVLIEKTQADFHTLLHDRREGVIPQLDLLQERVRQFNEAFDRHCGTMRMAIRLLVGFCLTLLIALILSITSESMSVWKHYLRVNPSPPPAIEAPKH